MLDEQTELTDKLVKLRQYVATVEFCKLDERDRQLLSAQSAHMAAYSDVLAQRIARFDTD
jgi:hypothetical protein